MKADTLLAIFGAAFLLAACSKEPEIEVPPQPVMPRVNFHDSWTSVTRVEVGGIRCAVLRVVGESGGISCDWSRPPIYGDVESADAMPASCTTDTDCMEKFGGDGGPAPRTRF